MLKRFTRYILLSLFTLLVFSTLIKLGLWQLDRANEKDARLEQMQVWQQQGGVPLDKALKVYQQTPELANDILVLESGQFIASPLLLLDNQVDNGRYGFRVLQAFETASNTVLVNLGWIQGDRSRQTIPTVSSLTQLYTLKGSVRIVEPGIQLQNQILEEKDGPIVIQQIELDKISRLINKQLLPFVIYLDKNEDIGYKKDWQPIVMPPEKHRGYAFQWFSLAIAWVTLMGFAAVKYKNNKA